MTTRSALRSLLFTLCFGLLGATLHTQEVLKIEDQGALREFILIEDEVLITGAPGNEERLRDDIEVALPGAKVIESRGPEALTKLTQPVNRRRAATRMEPIQQAAPEYRT